MQFKHKTTGQIVYSHDFYGDGEWPNNVEDTTYLLDVFPEPLKLITFYKRYDYVNVNDPSDVRTMTRHNENFLMRTEDFISQYEPVPEEKLNIN